MKRVGMTLTLMLMILPVLAAAQQLGPTDHIVANVPFQFMLGTKVVPAGTYIVQPTSQGAWDVNIQNPAAKVSAAFMVTPDESKTSREGYSLIFHKYGENYFLTGIGLEGTAIEKLRETKAESELRSKGNVPSETVVAALR